MIWHSEEEEAVSALRLRLSTPKRVRRIRRRARGVK
jgi:hypothetical protein